MGKQMGMPPRTGLEPFKDDFPETKSLSTGEPPDLTEALFQETTVAPYSRISTDEPCSNQAQHLRQQDQGGSRHLRMNQLYSRISLSDWHDG